MGGEGRHRWEPSANTLAYARIRGLGTGARSYTPSAPKQANGVP
jgi:hypothetical protein